MSLAPLDLAILIAYMAGVVVLGVVLGGKQSSFREYALGDRNLPWWLVLFSIVATETSTVSFLSVPGYAYGKDLTWIQLPLGYVVGRFVVVALLLPLYFKGELFTAYEVLERRFGGATKRVASVLFLITRTLADGLRLYLTAVVLQQVAGLSVVPAVLAVGAGTLLYTWFGGMRAVVWTDFVQLGVYLAGAVLALVLLAQRAGGLDTMLAQADAAGKLRLFDLRWLLTEPYVLWAGLIGGAFLTLATHGTDQMMVQRYLSARSQRQAAFALGLSGFFVLAQFALFLLIGVGLFVFYQQAPPAQAFARNDEVFAAFIAHEVPAGVRGVLLGAVFAAAMSTVSSSLNSSATTAVQDLWKPLLRPDADARLQLRASRAFTLLFGVAQIAVGIAGQWTERSVIDSVLMIAGFTSGIVLGVYLLGIATRVDQAAALMALLVGLVGMTCVAFLTSIAWPWYPVLGSLGTLTIGTGIGLVRRSMREP